MGKATVSIPMKATTTIGFSRPEHNHVPASPGKARSTLHEAIKEHARRNPVRRAHYQHFIEIKPHGKPSRPQPDARNLRDIRRRCSRYGKCRPGKSCPDISRSPSLSTRHRSLEVEVLLRIKERSDDRRLHGCRQQCLEAERLHALYQYFVVLAVTGVTGCHPLRPSALPWLP